jgi:hypothetical protein
MWCDASRRVCCAHRNLRTRLAMFLCSVNRRSTYARESEMQEPVQGRRCLNRSLLHANDGLGGEVTGQG